MRPIILTFMALSLAGCASDGGKSPICDGRHLRPANPYGSTLSPAPPAQLIGVPSPHATPPAAPADAKPASTPKGCGA